MRSTIVALADIHGHLPKNIPEGDILLVAGDLCPRGTLAELQLVSYQLARLPHEHKIVIAGNHDFCLEQHPTEAEAIVREAGCYYLRDQLVTVRGLKIYGSPWNPWFHDWAFNLERGPALAEKWKKIPYDLDVLLVHAPPLGFGDLTARGERVGDADLLAAIREKKPKNVFYGHIHEDTGSWPLGENTMLFNCSVGMIYSGPRKGQTGTPVVISMEKKG